VLLYADRTILCSYTLTGLYCALIRLQDYIVLRYADRIILFFYTLTGLYCALIRCQDYIVLLNADRIILFSYTLAGLNSMLFLTGRIKGTVSRDFLLLVFFMNQFPPSPRVSH
jgi:hypothetical protein